jgi:hypothetical protein
MFRLRPHSVVVTLLLSGLAAGPAFAQNNTQATQGSPDTPIASRAEQIAREQADRARTTRPYQPTTFEKTVDLAEDLILNPPRVYPWFGSIYPGGLFALGAGLRQPYGDTGLFDVHGGW